MFPNLIYKGLLRDIIVSIAIYGNTPAAPLREYRGGRVRRGHSGSYSLDNYG
jgi:hypothetical protein